jgi:hypothetical protein
VSLARMGKLGRPDLKVIFAAEPEFATLVDRDGEVFPHPVNVPALVACVGRLLAEQAGTERQAAD